MAFSRKINFLRENKIEINFFRSSWPWAPAFFNENEFVALQLCPPLQFGPLTYQPIEWGFVSSNQSAL